MMATNTPEFNSDIYLPIASNHLVVYCIYSLQNDGDEISSEDIISACFTLFPKKFSLKKYPQWPDAAMISRRWIECQSKGYIAAKTEFGFKLTAIGTKIAEKVAKTLGVAVKTSRPKKMAGTSPSKKAQPASTEKTILPAPNKKTLPSKPDEAPKVEQEPKTEVEQKTAPPVPLAKVEKQKQAAPAKKIIPAPVIEAPKVAEKTAPPVPLAKVEKQKQSAPAKKIIPAPVFEAPKVAEKTDPPVPLAKVEKQKQAAPAKKIIPAPVIEAPKVKQEPKSSVTISQEAKARAGKFVRMMETSDAYRHYKKSGAKSNIGEFDFRSLLLCTMESSPETLEKNLELFKGYAEIYNHQDLITFLSFCKDKFSYLFMPQKKVKRKK